MSKPRLLSAVMRTRIAKSMCEGRRCTRAHSLHSFRISNTFGGHTMRKSMMNLLAIPLLAACTSDGADVSSRAVDEQSRAQTRGPKVTMETVYTEPADRDVATRNAKRSERVNEESARAMRAQRDDAAIALDIDYVAQGAPEGTNDLARRLRAREIELIPSAEELKADEHVVQKLLFIEDNTALLLERQRALSLMRHFYTDEVRARLIDRAQDESLAAAIRATALRGLVAASDPEDTAVQQILEHAREDKSPRIRNAAQP